jgi:hypothetical protein
MNLQLASLLIVTAVFPVVGAAGVLVAMGFGGDDSTFTTLPPPVVAEPARYRFWAMLFAQLGFWGGTVCGGILAALMASGTASAGPIMRLSLCQWVAFAVPQSPSIEFGLETTWIKAALMSFMGLLVSIAVWSAHSSTRRRFSDDALLATSLLYAAGVFFVFAPNTAQALLGWTAVSALTAILMRLARERFPITDGDDHLATERSRSFARAMPEGTFARRLEILGAIAAFVERTFEVYVWKTVTTTWLNWCGEQLEALEESTASFQRMTIVLWASAILLTWIAFT